MQTPILPFILIFFLFGFDLYYIITTFVTKASWVTTTWSHMAESGEEVFLALAKPKAPMYWATTIFLWRYWTTTSDNYLILVITFFAFNFSNHRVEESFVIKFIIIIPPPPPKKKKLNYEIWMASSKWRQSTMVNIKYYLHWMKVKRFFFF